MRKSKLERITIDMIHRMGIAFASSRMQDYKYPEDIKSSELREMRYANFLTDYSYIITRYQQAATSKSSSIPASVGESLNVSLTLFDSIIKID